MNILSLRAKRKHRHGLYMACSKDGRHTWDNKLNINGDKIAGYSALVQVQHGNTVIAWQTKKPMLDNLQISLQQ